MIGLQLRCVTTALNGLHRQQPAGQDSTRKQKWLPVAAGPDVKQMQETRLALMERAMYGCMSSLQHCVVKWKAPSPPPPPPLPPTLLLCCVGPSPRVPSGPRLLEHAP